MVENNTNWLFGPQNTFKNHAALHPNSLPTHVLACLRFIDLVSIFSFLVLFATVAYCRE